MSCLLKCENRSYTIVAKENSDQCVVFKKDSSLPPLKGRVINVPQLHVPLSRDFFDIIITSGVKNVYKVDVRKTLKMISRVRSLSLRQKPLIFRLFVRNTFLKNILQNI